MFSDASCSDINSEDIFSDALFSEGSDDEGYRTNPLSLPSKEDFFEEEKVEKRAPVPQTREKLTVIATSTGPSPIDTKSMLDKWETKLAQKPEAVTSSNINNARESLSELQTLEARRKQIEEKMSQKQSSPPAEIKPAISLGYSSSLRDKRTALEQNINRSASGRSIRQESLSAEDREEALTRSRSARLMWETKTKIQRRRADSSSDDEVLYTDNTRGQLNEEETKRERPPVRNMTLDEDALLAEVDLSESQAHAIIKDLDLTVDDVTSGNQQSEEDNDPEIEKDSQPESRSEKDEIEDISEDLGGHEIIIDESLSEEDENEDVNAYADQLETPDELKLRHESTPSELADYDEVKLNTPLNSTMRVPVSLPEDSLDKEQAEEFVFQKEVEQTVFQKEVEEEKETDPESVYLSAQEEQENEQFLSLGDEHESSKSENEEDQKRSSSPDESAEPDLSKIVVSEDEDDDFPEPCPDPTPAADTVQKPNQIEITNNEILQLPESSEINESNNNR